MKHSKLALSIVFLMLVSLVMAACGDSTATPSTSATTTAAGQSTTGAQTAATGSATTAAGTAAATSAASTASSGHPGIYREAWYGVDPVTLDPQSVQIGGDTTLYMYGNLYIGLTDFDQNLKVVPGVAKEWKADPSSMKWTFTLNPNAKFSSGRTVTTADVIYSFERGMDPKLKNYQAMGSALGVIAGATDKYTGKADKISGLKAIDDSTLEITLSRPCANFDVQLASGRVVSILDKDVVENGGAKWWETKSAGAGPFQLSEWQHNQKIVLTPNPNWFGSKVKLTRIEYLMVGDQTNRLSLFESGQTDGHWQLLTAEIDRVTKDKDGLGKLLVTLPVGIIYTYALQFNSKAYEPFKDAKVRQAVTMAIDSPALNEVALNNAGYVATGLLSNGMPGFKADQMKLKYDPAGAKKLLADAGFADPSKMPTLTITQVGAGADASNTTQYVQNSLKTNLGMNVEIQVVDQQRAIPMIQQGQIAAWTSMLILNYPEPLASLGSYLSTSPSNYYGYSNPEVDALLNKAVVTQDLTARYALYQDAEAKILADAAVMPLMWGKFYYLQRPWVSGYRVSPLGIMPFTELEVK